MRSNIACYASLGGQPVPDATAIELRATQVVRRQKEPAAFNNLAADGFRPAPPAPDVGPYSPYFVIDLSQSTPIDRRPISARVSTPARILRLICRKNESQFGAARPVSRLSAPVALGYASMKTSAEYLALS